jgi:hypothetical protein
VSIDHLLRVHEQFAAMVIDPSHRFEGEALERRGGEHGGEAGVTAIVA